ncbi:hypothetical protein ACMFMG_009810 [Clarireedia jacksonii]
MTLEKGVQTFSKSSVTKPNGDRPESLVLCQSLCVNSRLNGRRMAHLTPVNQPSPSRNHLTPLLSSVGSVQLLPDIIERASDRPVNVNLDKMKCFVRPKAGM